MKIIKMKLKLNEFKFWSEKESELKLINQYTTLY